MSNCFYRQLLWQRKKLQQIIVRRYNSSVYRLVEQSVSGQVSLLDVVSDVGASSFELFKAYQDVCTKIEKEEKRR